MGILVVCGAAVGGVAADAPHTHPDEIDEDGDLDALEGWLGDRMGEIHADCSEGVSVGAFDACEMLDEEYDAFFERHVTVEDETTDDDEERASDLFGTTGSDHAEYAELVEEFYATLEAYEDAREAGDDERAAQLAMELRAIHDRIQELGVQLQGDFEELDAITTIDLDPAIENTEQTTTEASSLFEAVENETFTATTLTAEAGATASFADPATVTGKLHDENGTVIADARIVIDDGDGVQTTRTDADGTFELAYRPTPTSTTGVTELGIRYEPQGDAPYQRATTTLDVDIEATPSAIDLDPLDSAAFQDNVTVAGTVTANGTGIEDVPVTIELADDRNTTVETRPEGHFAGNVSLPMTVPPGTATVEASVGDVEFALEPSSESTTLEVTETSTTLDVEAETGSETATVSGQLQTVDEVAVAGRPIDVEVGDETRTGETDDDGTFAVELPAADAERTATVTYAEAGTNLASSTETIGIAGAESSLTETIQSFIAENPLLASLLALVGAANVLVWGAIFAIRWRRWRANRRGFLGDSEAVSGAVDGESGRGAVETGPKTSRETQMLAEPAGPDLPPEITVQRAYATVRSTLGEDRNGDSADVRTHWEFYQELASEVDSDTQEALRTVTEAFEAATFAPSPIGEERADAAVDAAKRCVTVSDGG